jgi:creatinine amidohydrolase
MLTEIVASLAHHGIRKILLINGHGGNDFTPLVRQIQADLDVFMFWCHVYEVGQDKHNEIFDTADDHAGELETSMALALFPDLVELEQANSGVSRPFQFDALEQGWIKTSRKFSNLNDHCGNSDPSLATAEKGQQYLDFICQRISNFLIELAEAKINDHFPHFPGIKY